MSSSFSLPGAKDFSKYLCDRLGETDVTAGKPQHTDCFSDEGLKRNAGGGTFHTVSHRGIQIGIYLQGTAYGGEYLAFDGRIPGYTNPVVRGDSDIPRDSVGLLYQGTFPSGERVDGHKTIPFP